MHMPGTHKRQTSSLLLLTVACCTCCAAAAYSESIFSKANQYPVVWWAVNGPDIPGLANNALAMRSDTADAEAFSQDVIVSLAKGQRTRTAKAIGYMINANSTYGGGCPNPAPPVNILQRFGRAFAAAILAGDDQEGLWGSPLAEVVAGLDTPNVTEASLRAVNGSVVADTMLGGLFAAARSCTQPNALTGSSQAAVVAKYVDATCFYAGHILRGLTSNSTRHIGSFDRTLAADIRLANSTDPYVTSPVLQAFQKCQSGPASVLRPPSWLGQAFAQQMSLRPQASVASDPTCAPVAVCSCFSHNAS